MTENDHVLVQTLTNNDIEDTKTKRSIIKNIVILNLSFLLLFIAVTSLIGLQSTLNKDGGLGTSGLAIMYASVIASCMFTPSFLVNKLGCKWTIAVSMLCYVAYFSANMHAKPYLMYPAAAILGIGAAPLWSAESTYITESAALYAKLTETKNENVINKFFGIFFMSYQLAGVIGNILPATLLKPPPYNITANQLEKCGAGFCPNDQSNITNLARPDPIRVYIIVGCYLGCGALAFFCVVCFLDNIVISHGDERDDQRRKPFRLLIATMQHCWISRKQKFLIPLNIYLGVQQAFQRAELTKASKC